MELDIRLSNQIFNTLTNVYIVAFTTMCLVSVVVNLELQVIAENAGEKDVKKLFLKNYKIGVNMKRDTQKPILFKSEPEVFAQIELLKEKRPALNRNKMINDAMTLYIKLIKTLGQMEILNDITYNQDSLQRFLFKQCKDIQREWKRIY